MHMNVIARHFHHHDHRSSGLDKQFHQSSQYRIQRSCEDYCCRRSNLIRKSINSATYDYRRADRCELSKVIIFHSCEQKCDHCDIIAQLSHCFNVTAYCLWIHFFVFVLIRKQTEMSSSAGGGSLKLVPFIVQIFSSKSKTPICLGSLIHPQIVMTTLVCASMWVNNGRQPITLGFLLI